MAAEAAEAVRALNHATAVGAAGQVDGAGYLHPADLDATLVGLSLMAFRVPQALVQARGWLTARHGARTIGHDSHLADAVQAERVDRALVEIAGHLVDAVAAVQQLADSLDRARQHTAHLTTRTAPRAASRPAAQRDGL